MTYTPREIKDRVAVGDDIFIVEDLGDNRVKLIPAPTHISEPGTPVNKALLQPIEDYLATGVVPVERTITAGNGLSGGGSLNADRTLSLGTPGTLSGATSNNVTDESHTHAISVATQAEAEAGTNNVKLMTPLRVANALNAMRDALFPSGGIIMWSGSIGSIPAGWHLCDGTNGTPDLRDRFIVGAGNSYSPGDTGGSATIDTRHSHTFSGNTGYAQGGHGSASGNEASFTHYPNHYHPFSGTTGTSGNAAQENRPPYYALAYIMKL